MVIEEPSPEKPKEPKDPRTPEQIESHDEQTVFMLATLMVDLHTSTLLRQKNMVANAFLKAGVVLRNNPGFLTRFKAEQAEIMAHVKSQAPPKPPDLISLQPKPKRIITP